MQQFLLRSNIGVTSRGKYARAWDVHVEMAVIRSWGFPGAHDRYSSATVCHMAGVRSPCAEVRRIDNLFTISARARTSTRVRWRTAVIYAVTRNNSRKSREDKKITNNSCMSREKWKVTFMLFLSCIIQLYSSNCDRFEQGTVYESFRNSASY